MKNNTRKKKIHSYLKHRRALKVKTLKSLKSLRKSNKRQQLRVQSRSKKRTSMMKRLKLISHTTLQELKEESQTIFVMVTKQTFITIITIRSSTNIKFSTMALPHNNNHIHMMNTAKHMKKRG